MKIFIRQCLSDDARILQLRVPSDISARPQIHLQAQAREQKIFRSPGAIALHIEFMLTLAAKPIAAVQRHLGAANFQGIARGCIQHYQRKNNNFHYSQHIMKSIFSAMTTIYNWFKLQTLNPDYPVSSEKGSPRISQSWAQNGLGLLVLKRA